MTVKEKIHSLIGSANAATGQSSQDLTAAVGDLIKGYGSGAPAGMSFGEFILDTDTVTPEPIVYGLDNFPNFLFIYASDMPWSGASETYYVRWSLRYMNGVYWDDENQYYDYDYNKAYVSKDSASGSSSGNIVIGRLTAYTDDKTHIDVPYVGNYYYKSGVKYRWIAIRTEDTADDTAILGSAIIGTLKLI